MRLGVKRIRETPKGIFGELLDAQGERICFTAEHSYDGVAKLPEGTYTCVRGIHELSKKIPFETFEVTNVPGHTGILFHVGNNPQIDSEGCILLGTELTGVVLHESILAFGKFMTLTEGLAQFQLVVSSV